MRLALQWMITAALMLGLSVRAFAMDKYTVKQNGHVLEIDTPYGKKIFYGTENLEETRNYKVEIPISSLKSLPEAPPTEVKEKKSTDDEDNEPDEEDSKEDKKSRKPSSTSTAPEGRVVVEYDDTDRLVLEANRLYNKGKFYDATSYVDELLRKKPEFVRGWIMKGSLMFVQNQKDLAKKAWQQALVLDPQNSEVKMMLERCP